MLTVLLIIPKTLFALLVVIPTWLFDDKSLNIVTPRSLTLCTLFRDFSPRVSFGEVLSRECVILVDSHLSALKVVCQVATQPLRE